MIVVCLFPAQILDTDDVQRVEGNDIAVVVGHCYDARGDQNELRMRHRILVSFGRANDKWPEAVSQPFADGFQVHALTLVTIRRCVKAEVWDDFSGSFHTLSAAGGRAELFDQLKETLTAGKSSTAYAELATKLHLSEGALKVAVHRLRHRYRELLRAEIAHTVASEEEIDDEIRYLFAALSP